MGSCMSATVSVARQSVSTQAKPTEVSIAVVARCDGREEVVVVNLDDNCQDAFRTALKLPRHFLITVSFGGEPVREAGTFREMGAEAEAVFAVSATEPRVEPVVCQMILSEYRPPDMQAAVDAAAALQNGGWKDSTIRDRAATALHTLAEKLDDCLQSDDPIKLALDLNYAIFLYECADSADRAIEHAKGSLDMAKSFGSGSSPSDEDRTRSVKILMQLLQDHLSMWTDGSPESLPAGLGPGSARCAEDLFEFLSLGYKGGTS